MICNSPFLRTPRPGSSLKTTPRERPTTSLIYLYLNIYIIYIHTYMHTYIYTYIIYIYIYHSPFLFTCRPGSNSRTTPRERTYHDADLYIYIFTICIYLYLYIYHSPFLSPLRPGFSLNTTPRERPTTLIYIYLSIIYIYIYNINIYIYLIPHSSALPGLAPAQGRHRGKDLPRVMDQPLRPRGGLPAH